MPMHRDMAIVQNAARIHIELDLRDQHRQDEGAVGHDDHKGEGQEDQRGVVRLDSQAVVLAPAAEDHGRMAQWEVAGQWEADARTRRY